MRIALAIGDAAGVGPELAAKLLSHAEMQDKDILVLGTPRSCAWARSRPGWRWTCR